MNDEKYYLNNKLYNISKSVELYEYIEMEPSGLMFMGRVPMTIEVRNRVFKSPKGNLFKTIVKSKRINIVDINDDNFKEILLSKNALDILEELYPQDHQRLEEY